MQVRMNSSGKHEIVHAGQTVDTYFDSKSDAWNWADSNIDDQLYDTPNTISPPLVYKKETI